MRKLFVNGKIRTIDKDNHLVTAFAVEDGKFIAVGTEEEVRKAAGNCETIDLQGRDVLPGFVDAHLHFLDHAIYELFTADLYDTKSPDELVDVMKKYLEERKIPEGDWITGFGWDQELYPNSVWPTCRDLDRISDKHPIMLTRRCGTICVANSMAMKIAGIDKNTPDPQGGELVRFEDGSPNGVMLEKCHEPDWQLCPENE